MSKIIYHGRDIVVRFVPAENGCGVVTFSSWVPSDLGRGGRGFGEGVFSRDGNSELHIIALRNHWYQTDEMDVAIALIRLFRHQVGRLVSYGASMGAYACLNFSDQIKADTAICFSPQYSVDPSKVSFDSRWSTEAARINFLQDGVTHLDEDTQHYVFF